MRKMTDKTEERIEKLEDMTKQHRSELDSYDVDFRKMLARIEQLENIAKEQADELSEVEEQLNNVNDDLDIALSIVNKLEQLIALWNEKHPNDQIFTHRKRPMSDYTMTDQEWKEATRVPHPREWKKKFDPTTGEFQ